MADRSEEMWGDRDIRKEQLRVTVAIAVIAVAYYARGLPFYSNIFYGGFSIVTSVLAFPWGLYLFLIAVATADDLAPFKLRISEKWCRRSRTAAHFSYYLGITLVLAAIALLVLILFTYSPPVSS